MRRVGRVACVAGLSALDLVGVLPAFYRVAPRGCRAGWALFTFSYYSVKGAARLAARVRRGGRLTLLGYASAMAPWVSRAAAARGVVVDAYVPGRFEWLDDSVVVEVVRLPGYYRALPSGLKRRVSELARLVDAYVPNRAALSRILAGFAPRLAEAVEVPEVDAEGVVESLASRLESELSGIGVNPAWVFKELRGHFPERPAWDDGETAILVASSPLKHDLKVLLLPLATRLTRELERRRVLLLAPTNDGVLVGAGWAWDSEAARAAWEAERQGFIGRWLLSVRSRGMILEGIAEPGPRVKPAQAAEGLAPHVGGGLVA